MSANMAVDQQTEASAGDDEISLIDLITTIGEEKRFVAATTGVAVALGLAIALLIPPTYTARTTMLPPQQNQSASSPIAASLGALVATAGAGAFRTPEELYIGLLKSDSIADELIRKFNLQQRYEVKYVQDARKQLAERARFTADRKSSIITVEVDDKDPAFAAQLANAFAENLRKLLTRIAVTEAQLRRQFFEQQVEKAKSELARAELAVKDAQEKSGLMSLDVQTQTTIGAAAQIRAQIVAREVQLRAMQAYAGPENAERRRLLSELASLRTELGKLESGGAANGGDTRDGAQALANVRIFRELKYQEAMYSAMLQQLQLAKADEARDAPLVPQVDVAVPPERKSKPRRSLIVIGAFALGVLVGLAGAFARRSLARARREEGKAEQLQALVRAWSLRKNN